MAGACGLGRNINVNGQGFSYEETKKIPGLFAILTIVVEFSP